MTKKTKPLKAVLIPGFKPDGPVLVLGGVAEPKGPTLWFRVESRNGTFMFKVTKGQAKLAGWL